LQISKSISGTAGERKIIIDSIINSKEFLKLFETSPFNTQQPPLGTECNTIAVGNYTTGEGVQNSTNGCWSLSTVYAKKGDVVNVHIYYHNASNTNATNVRIKLWMTPTKGISDNFTFQTVIASDQGILISDPVNVKLKSKQTLTFFGSRLNVGQPVKETSFINNQSGAEIITSKGLFIGTVSPGMNAQGSLVTGFDVADAP
jgi:hypothetical protein